MYLVCDAHLLICGFSKCKFDESSRRVLHFSLGNYETCVWQQDFTKDSVVSCFPFCKPSPILVRDSCNAPVCVEITTKLCIKVFLKILNLLCVVCEQQGMEYLGRKLFCFVHAVCVIQNC